MKWLIIIVAVILLIAGAIAGAMFFLGEDEAAAEETAGEEVKPDVKPAIYKEIEPAILVNFGGKTRYRYLQLGIKVMSRDPHAMDVIEQHMPAVRNSLILSLSDQDPEVLTTRDGKQNLADEVRSTLQQVIEEKSDQQVAGSGDGHGAVETEPEAADHADSVPQIEEVYFTNFVMQ